MQELRTFNKTVGSVIVVDTGLLIEYLSGTNNGKIINEMIFKNEYIISVLVSPLTLVEIYFLIRRSSTREETTKSLNKIKELVKIIPIGRYLELLGEIKALTTFSLTDCANIALAECRQSYAVFKHEREIDKKLSESKDVPYLSRIVFIDDFSLFKG